MHKQGLKEAEFVTCGPLSVYNPHTQPHHVTFVTAKTVGRKTSV